jgi:hypothetical protein
MKELIDYDLDIYNILKDFPESDDEAYIYIRIHKEKDDLKKSLYIKGTAPLLAATILDTITENDHLREALVELSGELLKRTQKPNKHWYDKLFE